ncbi:MAG TPA: hypothetical protein VK574_17155 [Terracidiphilus sp.]|jgi:hypothetical protein|nr:hypothetical protein [Terracidiphilus sp.]
MTAPPAKEPLMKRLMRWIVPDQRVANRHSMPPVVAYLGQVRCSKIYKIGDVSIAGFFMVTDERWIHGTGFPVTLERTDDGAQGETLTVYSTVVRTGADGVGFTFLQQPEDEQHAGDAHGTTRMDLTKLAQFLKGLQLSEPNSESFERAS